jgi:exodeoxyribonuclease VII large subunit
MVPEIDVVIIGRGGGSAEDLWAFNDERLARAISASPVPIISAVGHEVDFTIADMVADLRAATPSNAAELVVDRADSFCTRIEHARGRLQAVMRLRLGRDRARAERLGARLEHWSTFVMLRDRDSRQLRTRLERAMTQRLNRLGQQTDVLERRLEARDLRRVAAALKARLVGADGRLHAMISARRLGAAVRLGSLAARLGALSPLAVLARGYAVCWDEARATIIRSAKSVHPGDGVRVTLAEGELSCRVEDVDVT